MNLNRLFQLFGLVLVIGFFACGDDEEPVIDGDDLNESDYTDLLRNQVNEIILPTMAEYKSKTGILNNAVISFASSKSETDLTTLKVAYSEAYEAYQAAAIHNYYATQNQALVETTNLYPVDSTILNQLIAYKSYNFNGTAQQRANGFPAIDFLLYKSSDALSYLTQDSLRISFLSALVSAINVKAEDLYNNWNGSLKANFIDNGGTALGSSISTQLNVSVFYFEDHVRENKVGIPIGRLGPNDSPITADPTKIEAFYQAQQLGNESFNLNLAKVAVQEYERLYLGKTRAGVDLTGYDDLLVAQNQTSVDTDIKSRFQAIYTEIDSRTSMSGNDELYKKIQSLITLYKSDLFPILNVQDADGANDGD